MKGASRSRDEARAERATLAKEMATRMLSGFRYTNGVLFECHFKDNGSWTLSDLGAVIRYGQADLHTHGVIVSPKTYCGPVACQRRVFEPCCLFPSVRLTEHATGPLSDMHTLHF